MNSSPEVPYATSGPSASPIHGDSAVQARAMVASALTHRASISSSRNPRSISSVATPKPTFINPGSSPLTSICRSKVSGTSSG